MMKNKEDATASESRYRNYYRCPDCGTEWDSKWSCTCDDRCPNCDTECAPAASEDLDTDPMDT